MGCSSTKRLEFHTAVRFYKMSLFEFHFVKMETFQLRPMFEYSTLKNIFYDP